jgi:hypothetical protein
MERAIQTMKRKLAAAALALSATGLPAAAVAQSAPKVSEGIFANRGQCEAALHRIRNQVREQLRPLVPPNVVNETIRNQVYCARFRDGYAIFAPPT